MQVGLLGRGKWEVVGWLLPVTFVQRRNYSTSACMRDVGWSYLLYDWHRKSRHMQRHRTPLTADCRVVGFYRQLDLDEIAQQYTILIIIKDGCLSRPSSDPPAN